MYCTSHAKYTHIGFQNSIPTAKSIVSLCQLSAYALITCQYTSTLHAFETHAKDLWCNLHKSAPWSEY